MTVYGVQDAYEASLSIDGLDLVVSKTAFKEITVRSGLHRDLPTIFIHFDDKGSLAVRHIGTADGKSAQVYLNDGRNGVGYSGTFVLMGGAKCTISPHGIDAQYSGVLDAVPWMRKVSDAHFKGTSAEMMAMLGAQAGLGAVTSATSDFMTWLPNRRTLSQQARFVAERGYAGPTSCMIMAVTGNKTLLYRNVEDIMNGGSSKLFDHAGKGIRVWQFEVASKAGAYNHSAAYGASTMGDKITGEFLELGKTALAQFSNLGVSSALAGQTGKYGGRISPFPVNPGNVFEKYIDAQHQNRRIKSTYSNDIHIMTDTASGVELMDKVTYLCADPMTLDTLEVFSGEFMITNKVITLRDGRYYEKLTLTNQG